MFLVVISLKNSCQRYLDRNQYVGSYSQRFSFPIKYYAERGGAGDAIIEDPKWDGYTNNFPFPLNYYGQTGGFQPIGSQQISFPYNTLRQKSPSLMHAYAIEGAEVKNANYFFDKSLQLISLFEAKIPPLTNAALIDQALKLIQEGANINEFDKEYGHTPLYMALANKDIDYTIITFLLKNGANVFYQDMFAGTALTMAAKYGREVQVTKALVDAGASVLHRDIMLNTPINYFLQSAKRFKDAGDIPSYNNALGSIYFLIDQLFQQKQKQNSSNVWITISSEGDYSADQTLQPSTTLSWIAYLGDINLARRYISLLGDLYGIYINKAVNGLTAYDWAGDNLEMKGFLRAYGGQKGPFLLDPPSRETPILKTVPL